MVKYGKNFKSKYLNKDHPEFKVDADVYRQPKKDIAAALENSKRNKVERIPQVLAKKRANFDCDFALLKTVISTAVELISFEFVGFEHIRKMDSSEFMNLMTSDNIIKQYLKQSPQIVIQFIERTIKEIYDRFYMLCFHEMMFKSMRKE
jgi:hypothetical protein